MRCEEKKVWTSKREAKRARRRWRFTAGQRLYRCPKCGGWHLTKRKLNSWKAAA